MSTAKEQHIIPNPWHLKGSGLMLLYKFSRQFIQASPFIPEKLKENFAGGIGYVMLVNYKETPAGPYRELLFIPGKFRVGGKKRQVITKIYVDTQLSIDSGRANWGIPKEMAHFNWQNAGRQLNISVNHPDGQTILELQASKSLIPIPVSTQILPIRLRQELNSQYFDVQPTGQGWGKLIRLKKLSIPNQFPDVSQQRPLLGLWVEPFRMYFP